MMPESSVYGEWPASGEIDIMESKGNPSSYEISIPIFYIFVNLSLTTIV